MLIKYNHWRGELPRLKQKKRLCSRVSNMRRKMERKPVSNRTLTGNEKPI